MREENWTHIAEHLSWASDLVADGLGTNEFLLCRRLVLSLDAKSDLAGHLSGTRKKPRVELALENVLEVLIPDLLLVLHVE